MTCNDASSCQKACKHIQLCVSYLRIEHMCILKSQIRVVFVKCCSRASLRGSFAKSALRVPVAVLSAPLTTLASATRMRRHVACLLTLLPCGSPRPPLVTCDTATLTAARKNNMTRIVTCVVGGTFCSLSHLASLHDVFVVCGRCACRSELPQGSQAPDVRVGEEPSNSGDCLAEPHHCAASRYAL